MICVTTFDSEKKIKKALDTKRVLRTAAYIRVSTEEQAKHGFSIEAQKEGLKEYAEKRGFKIVEWYIDEGKSARKKTGIRKEYMRLIEDAKSGKFEMIIFKCLDRWFRNISEYYKAQSILDDKGIDWECSEEDYDTTTRDGRWKLHIYLMLAQDEADKTSERISYVFEHKIKNKEAITGTQPYGFKVKEIDGYKRVVKDESVQDIVMDTYYYFELYNSKRAALHFICDKYNIDFGYNVVSSILTNPYYYGHYRGVDDYVWGGSYVTKERFYNVQKMLKKNVKEKKNKVDYIFSGLLRCSHCGCALAGCYTKFKLADGRIVTYKSYRCNLATRSGQCNATGVFSELKLEESLIQRIEHEIEDYICNYELSLKKEAFKPEVDIKAIKGEMNRLNKQWRKNRIEESEYDEEYERLEKKLKKLEEEKPTEKDLTPLYEFVNSGWKNVYDTLDDKQKRALWRSVINYIEADVPTKKFEIKFI
jgi:DNA invertase Pin-like site-specific DNA recombinase